MLLRIIPEVVSSSGLWSLKHPHPKRHDLRRTKKAQITPLRPLPPRANAGEGKMRIEPHLSQKRGVADCEVAVQDWCGDASRIEVERLRTEPRDASQRGLALGG